MAGVVFLYFCFPTIEHSDNNSFGFRDQKNVLLEVLISVPLNLQLGQRITLFLASTPQSARHGWSYKGYKTPANIYTYMQKKKKNLHGKVVIPSEWNVLTYLEKKNSRLFFFVDRLICLFWFEFFASG